MSPLDDYEWVMGNEPGGGGMFLELWERSSNTMVQCAFYTDADGSMRFERYREDVSPGVEAWFRQLAHQKLPPVQG